MKNHTFSAISKNLLIISIIKPVLLSILMNKNVFIVNINIIILGLCSIIKPPNKFWTMVLIKNHNLISNLHWLLNVWTLMIVVLLPLSGCLFKILILMFFLKLTKNLKNKILVIMSLSVILLNKKKNYSKMLSLSTIMIFTVKVAWNLLNTLLSPAMVSMSNVRWGLYLWMIGKCLSKVKMVFAPMILTISNIKLKNMSSNNFLNLMIVPTILIKSNN